MITPPSPQEIYDKIVSEARDELGINVASNGSVFGALARGFTDVHSSLWEELAEADRASSLDRAVGTELDKIGEFLGVVRRKSEKASTRGYGPGVQFSNLGGISLPVTKGTAVFPSSDPTIIFRTLENINVPAYSKVSVDVEASKEGINMNVAAGALNSHNAGTPQLIVTNLRTIDSGSEIESDTNYRARIYQSVTNRNPGSKTAIREALTSLPGVRDVILFNNISGAGTFDVLLVGNSGNVPNESITAANNYLDNYAPVGVTYKVKIPREVPVDVTVVLMLNPVAEPSRSTWVNVVNQLVRSYFDSLTVEVDMGDSNLVWTDLISQIKTASENIKDFTIDIKVKERPLPLGSNYRPNLGERLVLRRVRID